MTENRKKSRICFRFQLMERKCSVTNFKGVVGEWFKTK